MCGFSHQKFTFVSQTASLTNVALFTPAVDGDYIIGVSGDVFGHNGLGDFANNSASIGWTGNDGTYSWPFSFTVNTGSPPYAPLVSVPTQVIHALAGDPVTLSVTWRPVTSPIGAQYYDIYVTVLGG